MDNGLQIFSLKDKVIILTGAAGFLGISYANALRKAGACLVLWDNDTKKLEDGANNLEGPGPLLTDTVEITNEERVNSATQSALNWRGRIDALINNAAMNPAIESNEARDQFVPYEDYDINLFRKELEVNLVGMQNCTKHVARVMIKQQHGSIINVASEVSTIAHDHRVYNDPGRFKSIGYITTKTAVLGFTRQWAARLGRHRVRVNAFSPGGVRNDKMPADFVQRFGEANMLGRMAENGEYYGAMIFLCSDASSFMTGANLIIDGGKSAW